MKPLAQNREGPGTGLNVYTDPNYSAGRAAEEVIQHLLVLPTADAEIVLEIQVRVPAGIPGTAVRTIIENCRTLKFDSFNFESE